MIAQPEDEQASHAPSDEDTNGPIVIKPAIPNPARVVTSSKPGAGIGKVISIAFFRKYQTS